MFAMEFAQPDYDWDDGAYQNNIEFTFKKSVFFADNYVVCLGSGIPLRVAARTSLRYILFT